MREPPLSRDDAVPLYHQIFLTLRDEILQGARPAGTILPTEHALAERWGVSRITARRALDELADHGLVVRRRRIGTQVTFTPATAPLEANLEQTVEALLAFGRDTRVRVLALEEGMADAESAAALGLAPGAPLVRAVRLRLLEGTPLGEVVSEVPSGIARGQIDRAALARAPMLALLQELGHRITGGRQTITALSADPDLAARLAIEPRAAVLRVERIVTGEGGAPILRTVARYRADRYRISLDLHSGAQPISAAMSSSE